MKKHKGVRIQDLGWAKILRETAAAGGIAATVGVHEAEGATTYPSGQTVAEVAHLHEYGTRDMPARPWLSEGMAVADVEGASRRAVEGIISGKQTAAQALGKAAESVAVAVREELPDLPLAPLAESTVEKKGSATPLVDTGELREAITARVVKANEVGS